VIRAIEGGMSLKILHILDHSVPLHSGYAFRTLSLLNEQRKLGWQTEQLTTTKHYGALQTEEELEGFKFYRTFPSPSRLWAMPVLNQWAVVRDTERRLREVIKLVKPDILHAHSPCLNGIAALRASKRLPCPVPVVYEMRASWEDAAVDHGSTSENSVRYKISRAMESWVLRNVDAVTTICEGLRNDILERGIDSSRVSVIPNGVDIEQFPVINQPDADLRIKLGMENAFVIGFIGSFYGYEGIDLIIKALPEILKFAPNARVLLVGGGKEEATIKKLVEQMRLQEVVAFTGRVPHSEVSRYYSLVDLLVYPRKSMRLTETVTPLKPLEAMAQGRLLAASSVGGHRELIADGETGFLFAADDPMALAVSVRRVLNSRDKWQQIRKQGRHFVESYRTWQSSAAGYVPIYKEVLHRVRHSG